MDTSVCISSGNAVFDDHVHLMSMKDKEELQILQSYYSNHLQQS